MWTVRPAQPSDVAAIVGLAAQARPIVHTLPRTPVDVAEAVERSVDSFAREVDLPGDESYLLVLQDPQGRLQGTAALRATAGSAGTFFCYRNDVLHHASPALHISNAIHVLSLCSELTAHSQLLSFYAAELGEHEWAAAMLSRARLMLAGVAPRRFAQNFFVSLAGWTDEQHRSPFWDALGRKFFGMDLIAVERALLGARDRSQITEVMPHYPVYVPLLPGPARAVLGQMHGDAARPFAILDAEGFEADRFVDIFDGGPILVAHRSQLRTLAGARRLTAHLFDGSEVGAERCLLASVVPAAAFRCCVAPVQRQPGLGSVGLPRAAALALGLGSGDAVLVAPL